MKHEVDDKPQSLTKPKLAKLYHSALRWYQRKIPLGSVFNLKLLTSSIVLDLNHITLISWLGKFPSHLIND